MAIKKQITFEGLTYNLDNRDRVAAQTALETQTLKKVEVLEHDGNSVGGAPWVQNSEVVTAWTQPANSLITNITIFCASAPTTAASVSLGWEVGTSSSGAQICTGDITDGLIDVGTDGTDMVAGALALCGDTVGGHTLNRVTLDDVTLAVDVNFAVAARTLYFTTACSNHAVTTAGSMRWIIEYYDLSGATKSGAA